MSTLLNRMAKLAASLEANQIDYPQFVARGEEKGLYFLALANDDPTKISFSRTPDQDTPDDRRVMCKAGKLLVRLGYSETQGRNLAEYLSSRFKTVDSNSLSVRFLEGDELVERYYEYGCGEFSSCQTEEPDQTALYGVNDYQLAEFWEGDTMICRRLYYPVVCNGEKVNLWDRHYPGRQDVADRVNAWLRTQSQFSGDIVRLGNYTSPEGFEILGSGETLHHPKLSKQINWAQNYADMTCPYQDTLKYGDGYGLNNQSGPLYLTSIDNQLKCCEHCGGRCDGDNSVYIEGHDYCSYECGEEDGWRVCIDCSGWLRESDAIEINGEYYCCTSCAHSNDYYQCDDCGEWLCIDDLYSTIDGLMCCEGCWESGGYVSCEHCGECTCDPIEANDKCYCSASCAESDGNERCPDCGAWIDSECDCLFARGGVA